MRTLRPSGALIVLIALIASVPPHAAQAVGDLLRQAAMVAGCPADRVRVTMRWQGEQKPVEIEVRCAEGPP